MPLSAALYETLSDRRADCSVGKAGSLALPRWFDGCCPSSCSSFVAGCGGGGGGRFRRRSQPESQPAGARRQRRRGTGRGRAPARLPGLRHQEHDARGRSRFGGQRRRRGSRRLPRADGREQPARGRDRRAGRLARGDLRRPADGAPAAGAVLFSDGGELPAASAEALEELAPSGADEADDAQVIRIGDAAKPENRRVRDVEGGSSTSLAQAIDRCRSPPPASRPTPSSSRPPTARSSRCRPRRGPPSPASRCCGR